MPRFENRSRVEGLRPYDDTALGQVRNRLWRFLPGVSTGIDVWLLADGSATLDDPDAGTIGPTHVFATRYLRGGHALPENLSLREAQAMAAVVSVFDNETGEYVEPSYVGAEGGI